jgi:predicted Zn-dependent peptidase
MKDRLLFETTVLDNGITIYSKPADVPFVYAWLYFPVGHAHNTGLVLPGTAHFLEHIVCNRSRLFPECDSFDQFVKLKGGDFNAATRNGTTNYTLRVRSDMFEPAFKGFVSSAFEPLLEEHDIINEANIIGNERRRKNKWYPGESELEYHRLTKWKHDQAFSLRQIFGEDPDLRAMNVEGLRQFHQNYFDPRTYLIIGGAYNSELVFKELSRFKTIKQKLPQQVEEVHWVNREYHEDKFSDLNRFMYHLGGIVDSLDPKVLQGIEFLGSLLVNTAHGVLYSWLRRELGWTYNMGFNISYGNPLIKSDWKLWLPVSTYQQSQEVRRELHGRIQKSLQDKNLLETELERRLSGSCFWYQTLQSILNSASDFLDSFGRIITETEWHSDIQRCKDTKFLQEIYETYWSPQISGEFLAIPEKV